MQILYKIHKPISLSFWKYCSLIYLQLISFGTSPLRTEFIIFDISCGHGAGTTSSNSFLLLEKMSRTYEILVEELQQLLVNSVQSCGCQRVIKRWSWLIQVQRVKLKTLQGNDCNLLKKSRTNYYFMPSWQIKSLSLCSPSSHFRLVTVLLRPRFFFILIESIKMRANHVLKSNLPAAVPSVNSIPSFIAQGM